VVSKRKRILVLNPNSSTSVTDTLEQTLTALNAGGGAEIRCKTLAGGPPAIESDDDVAAAAPLVEGYVADNQRQADAFVIACFSDPGLERARGAVDRPVFGMAECGYLTALARGARFGVVSVLAASLPRHRRYIRDLGIESRLAGDLPLDLGVLALSDPRTVVPRLREVGGALVDGHGADVLVLGCAGLAGYRAGLEDALGVPVVEPVQAAVAMAMGAVVTED
jgi:Asp/Glu/hydantoin racemase